MSQEPDQANHSTDTVKQRIANIERGDVSWKSYSDQWNENHGTLLMGFAAGIFLVGIGLLAYQQNRFRPAAFPTGQSISQHRSLGLDALTEDGSGDLAETDAVRLQVSGGSSSGGLVRIAIYLSAEHFNQPDNANWKTTVALDEAGNAQCLIPLAELADSFAIAVYQDSNDNSELDRNALGIPSERYGFSNAARGKLGPPAFTAAEVPRPEPGGVLSISIW